MLKVFLLNLILLSGLAHAHGGQEPLIVIEPEFTESVGTNSHVYRFQLFDTVKNKAVKETDLEVTNEKVLHFLSYDPALKEFEHVHPTFDGAFWNVTLNFPASGKFWLWAQGKISGGDEFSTPARIDVLVHQPAWPSPPRLTDVRQGSDGISQAVLGNQSLKAGRMAMLDLKFLRNDGSAPQITPYLGALAHVIAVTEDADSLIHVHAISGSLPNKGVLHVTFPSKGFYRLWIQFMDGAVLKTVPLSVKVN